MIFAQKLLCFEYSNISLRIFQQLLTLALIQYSLKKTTKKQKTKKKQKNKQTKTVTHNKFLISFCNPFFLERDTCNCGVMEYTYPIMTKYFFE